MSEPSRFHLEVLGTTDQFTRYRGHRPGEPPVLAVGTTAPEPDAPAVERLAHEYALGTDLDPAWAAMPLSLGRHDGRPLLLLEDEGGEPLDRMLDRADGRRFDVKRFLALASELARALGQMHGRGLVHKDIKPGNVLVHGDGRVRLTGFGIASRTRREPQTPTPPEVIAGTFAYMAPEQTGRMNRSVDARSDLYSLGITCYELLTGAPPFSAADPMEWIHGHIAREPVPPGAHVPDLPSTIDAIVLKLLAKNPEDRYQTAAGLELDLRRGLAEWDAYGRITPFPLAERDVPDRLVMPEKLYGREQDVAVLVEAFDRVVTRGATGLVLVSGYAGIGKSSIVNELHKVLVPSRGLFAAGKFDQYKRGIPYATLAQAFRGLVRQMLTTNDAQLDARRRELLTALGPNGQLVINVIPELALVIGDQPPPPAVEPQDASARFHRVFRNFVGVFATAAHPLVLFVDDLQWLDAATLELLAYLVREPEGLHLLLIGAYRDNEVDPHHPLSRTIAAISDAGGAVSEVRLTPLTADHVAQLCADALHTDAGRTAPLAALISEKTGGNPFFTIQFITALNDERLLAFDPARSAWQWDIDRIRAKGITDNVADLMAAKLSRLRPETREALGQLACLGNVADVRTAALVGSRSEDEVQSTLREAVEAGLVLALHRSFAFIHDRVHEAAYALMAPADRAAAHLRIGRLLSSSVTSAPDAEDRIFEIVNQFARGLAAIDSTAEREFVADLYLAAGKRAKTSGAYASALAYFAAGRELLGTDSWDHRYQLTLDLELNRAECEIVGGELQVAEERLTTLSQHASALDDQAQIVCLAVLLYFTTGRSERAVEVSLEFLSRVGVNWPARPAEADVRAEYEKMRRLLAGRRMADLIDLPAMSDPVSLTTMAVLTELFPAAYAVDRYLMELVLLRMTNLSLEHGHADSSSVAYSALNMALGAHFGDYATGYELGQIACELVNRRTDRFKARVYSCFAAFAMPWFKHVRLCRPLMTQAFEIGSSKGDMAFASYNSRNLMTHLLMAGTPLAEVQREAEDAMAFARKLQLGLPAERFIEQLALVRRLRGLDSDRAEDDEWATGDVEAYPQLAMMVCYHWVFRLEERYVAGDIAAALDAAARVDPIRWAMRSSIEEAEYDFYAALTRAAACDEAPAGQRAPHLRALAGHYDRIARWAANCPDNFANRQALIGAEIARLEGRDLDAQQLYEQAVRLARDQGFLQNQAFAHELAGRFHAARGLETSADAHLLRARNAYERWGALGKVRRLESRYPQLRTRAAAMGAVSSIDKPLAQLDVEIVDKASQTLSSEMVLPNLLEKLVRLAVEHAGAQRGLLVLLHDGRPHIEAEATTGQGTVDVALRRTPVTPLDLPESALQYVLRTHERLILDDASAEGLDRHDEYVRRRSPRSVLCLPIFKETRVIGALYLENNLTTRAFTMGRVAVLDFLASQAAIWLENARLYSELRRSEAWLQEAQHLSSTGSFYWRVEADTIEFSGQMYRIYELDPHQPITPALVMTRIHPDDLPLIKDMIDVARGPAGDLDYQFRARMPDLSIKHLHMVAHGTRDKDGGLAYVGAVQDVTQRRLNEDALGRMQSELARVARVTSLGVLTASIAHEVNQPLSGIVTNASTCMRMLGSDPPNVEGARETTRRMIRDGHRAAEVIARLRALFTRQDAATESVDLSDATREVIALSGSELRKHGVVLRAELDAELPLVTGDRVQLQQVVLNLLLNAADAVRSVVDRPRHVVVRTERDADDRVRLTVQDTGVGIDPEAVPHLFEPFYSTKAAGMGIGLSVSRAIIERHHGRIWAAAGDGPGAVFAFALPCSADAPQPAAHS